MLQEILTSVSSLFGKEVVWAMADKLGENKGDLSDALEHTIPAILQQIADKAATSDDMAARLMATAAEAERSSWWLAEGHPGDTTGALRSKELLKMLFLPGVAQQKADNLSAQFHIKPSSALALMQWVVPACFGMLGKYVTEHKPGVGSFAAGLSNSSYQNSSAENTEEPKVQGRAKFFWPLLLLLIAFAAWWFLKTRNDKAEAVAVVPGDSLQTAVENISSPATPGISFTLNEDSTLSYSLGDTITEKLPDGMALRVPAGSAEAQLIDNIHAVMENGPDTSAEGKKAAWINLYNVQFTKMLDYREGAVLQIRNIATILKAYPGVVIKLGGYTDDTGPADANKKLSLHRAEKVKAGFYTAGVGAQVESAEGYGPDFPVADNATPGGRAQNRRVACRVVAVKK